MSPGFQVFIPPLVLGRSLPKPLERGIKLLFGKPSMMIVLSIDTIAVITRDSGVQGFLLS